VIVPQLSISPRGAARCLIYKYRLVMLVEREDFAHLIVESPGGATPMACERHLMRELGSKIHLAGGSRKSRRNDSTEVLGQDSCAILR